MQTTLFSTEISRSCVRLFSPDESATADELDATTLTLRLAFERYKERSLKDRDGTKEQYLNAIMHWERLTDNPAVTSIDDDCLLAFRQRLEAENKRAHATINKIVRQLSGIFHVLGPRGHRNPAGKNLITVIPYVEPLQEEAPEKRTISADELSALYRVCDRATWPRGNLVAPLWWRVLLVLFYNWGLRTQDLLRREWTDLVPGDPDQPGRSRPDLTYLRIVPKKTRRKKPQPIFLPVTPVVALHLKALPRLAAAIFTAPKNEEGFYSQWRRLQAAAGIVRPYHIKNLRITCNTRANRVVPGAGSHILGHSQRGNVNLEFYSQNEEDIYAALIDLPQPEEFLAGPSASHVGKQLTLF